MLRYFTYMNAIQRVAFASLFLAFAISSFGQAPEKVINQDGKIQSVGGGKSQPIKQKVTFSGGIEINTNGVFKVGAGGKERKLENGQAITADGMLQLPN